MLTQLLEHHIDRLTRYATACDQIVKTRERLPVEYWQGYSAGVKQARRELRHVLRDISAESDPDIGDLSALLNRWIERTLNLIEKAGIAESDGDHAGAIESRGRLHAFQQAFRDVHDIMVYVDVDNTYGWREPKQTFDIDQWLGGQCE